MLSQRQIALLEDRCCSKGVIVLRRVALLRRLGMGVTKCRLPGMIFVVNALGFSLSDTGDLVRSMTLVVFLRSVENAGETG